MVPRHERVQRSLVDFIDMSRRAMFSLVGEAE